MLNLASTAAIIIPHLINSSYFRCIKCVTTFSAEKETTFVLPTLQGILLVKDENIIEQLGEKPFKDVNAIDLNIPGGVSNIKKQLHRYLQRPLTKENILETSSQHIAA